jgi:Calcineurin-like phosphoesterase
LRFTSALAGTICLIATAAAATHRQPDGRFDGEYGLWVQWREDSVTVNWITREPAPGFLDVTAKGKRVLEGRTRADTAHALTFANPDAGELTLRYGALPDSAAAATTVIRPPAPGRRPRVTWPAADSIVVISDIHGEYDRMLRVLQNAHVVGSDLRWNGGRKHLVIVGDVFDRGSDATRALWFIYGLEPQAERAGGRVHMLLGNHEIMVMTGDLRYTSAKEKEIARLYGTTYDRLFDPRTSVLGQWLTTRPAVLRMGDILFAHGGVSADYLSWTLNEVEDSLSAYTGEELFARWADSTFKAPIDSAGLARRDGFFWSERSIFWYRGYAQGDSTAKELDAVLHRFDATLAVVGHTPMQTGITERFGGRLIDVNTLPFVAQALLLTHERAGWNRWRIRETGPPERLRPPA